MIVRLVKLTFRSEETDNFLAIFDQVSDKIKACKGCLKLELLREKEEGNIFFTHSIWEDESDLEAYRNSDLFDSTWEKTKAMFSDKAEAWTTESIA
jgi:quinol monooxygenase YgiN